MHTLSKKELSSEELETLRRPRNSTTVVTVNGEVQTNEEAQVYVHDLDLYVTMQILDDTPAVLSLAKFVAKNTDTPMDGQRSKTTIDHTREDIFYAKRKTSYFWLSWIVVKFLYLFDLHIATAGLVKNIFKSSSRAK